LNETRKSLNAAQSKIEDYENRLTASEYSAATLADKVKEQQSKISESTKTTAALEGQLTVSEKERHALEVLVATLRSELEIKNQIFEKIGTEG
jgi:septal ring factor EnvC (AmiA/AmiB activator)